MTKQPNKAAYIPGVCNIGPAEIQMRRNAGHAGLIVALLLWAAMVLFDTPASDRFWVALPVTIAAVGYLQAWQHFCANFGWRGVFNVGNELGQTDTAAQAEYRRKDRRKAILIFVEAVLIGLAVGLAAVLLPA